tara:strand:+ start:691 stop:1044 length:354 start_codon:yes stop_codon:yes gene_type:complete
MVGNKFEGGSSRRKFLRNSTLAASVFSIVPRFVLGGVGHVPPSDLLNLGCVGVGGKGVVDVKGVSSENTIALCDVDDHRSSASFKAHPKANKYKDFREIKKMTWMPLPFPLLTICTP